MTKEKKEPAHHKYIPGPPTNEEENEFAKEHRSGKEVHYKRGYMLIADHTNPAVTQSITLGLARERARLINDIRVLKTMTLREEQ